METLTASPVLAVGVASAAVGAAVLAYLLLAPRPVRVPFQRRRPGQQPDPGPLGRGAEAATDLIERAMRRRGTPVGTSLLELAALRMRRQDFVFLVGVAAFVLAALVLLLSNIWLAILALVITPLIARLWLGRRIRTRQRQFGLQLDDCLQLMASSLRAGQSLPQALASVAKEAEEPTAEELTRVINESRVGRDLITSLADTAARMRSEDFGWVTQAIAINREVGGNLADVLDGVAHTIRERNDIRRQVATLSAEGRLSAGILMLLPFGVAGFLLIANPGYLSMFATTVIGWAMIAVSIILLLVGGLWLRKTVTIEF